MPEMFMSPQTPALPAREKAGVFVSFYASLFRKKGVY